MTFQFPVCSSLDSFWIHFDQLEVVHCCQEIAELRSRELTLSTSWRDWNLSRRKLQLRRVVGGNTTVFMRPFCHLDGLFTPFRTFTTPILAFTTLFNRF